MKKLLLFTIITSLSAIVIAIADVHANGLSNLTSDNNYEIEHLLNFVETSECSMDRNGTVHEGIKAAKHIKKKYKHFKDKIKTTEDFIELSASRSTTSGEDYYALCPGKEKITTSQWLTTELERYRNSNIKE